MPIGNMILSAMYGDPLSRMGQTLNPNPAAQGGAGGQGGPSAAPAGGGVAGQGQQGSASPPAPQDPSVGQYIADLYRRGQAETDIDRGTALMASAFGTAQQQHDLMAYATSTPASHPEMLVGEALKAQSELTAQQEHQRFVAGAAGLAPLLGPGVTPEMATTMAAGDPNAFNELVRAHTAAAAPTDTMKNINDYIQRARAQGVPEDEIQQNANDMLSQSIGHFDPLQKEFKQAWANARAQNPGKSDSEILAGHPELKDLITYQGAKVTEGKTAAETAEDKNNAKLEYTGMNNNFNNIESPLDWLSQHKDAAVAAIKYPQFLTRGPTGQFTGWVGGKLTGTIAGGVVPDQDVLTAATYLDQLKNGVSADKMAGMKNIRNQREFNAVGGSVTNLFAPTADATTISNQLDRLQQQTYNAHATSILAAGKTLPGKYAGYGDSAFLDPSNPLHNAGAADPNNLTGKSDAEVDAAVAKMAPGERFIGPDGQPHWKK